VVKPLLLNVPLYKLESFAKHLQDWAERVVDTVSQVTGFLTNSPFDHAD